MIRPLPDSWRISTFGALNQFPSSSISPANYPDEKFDLYSVPAFPNATPEVKLGKEIGSTKQLVHEDSVLVCKINPRINRVWKIPSPNERRQIASSEWIGFFNKELNPNFFQYFFRSITFRSALCANVIGVGGSLTRAQPKKVASIALPVAPINEQRRIADKLDRVLARVDAANEHLSRVAPLIKRFRQSVLSAAVSGRLTDACALPSQRWKKAKLGDLGTLARGKSKHRPRNDPSLYGGRYPFIQTGDIANSNGLITHHSRTYNDKGLAQSKLWPKGTLCITIAANIADTAILGYDACFPDSVVGFLVDESTCISKFVKYSIDVIKEDIERLAPATAQKNINLALLSEMPIRIPSVEEQSEIVRRVEKLFAFADRLEERLSQAQAAVQKLTPALLAKAFRGELVPQDPNDEPASELLKRLQENRTESAKPSRARKPRARKSL